jgi:hypothetical protein
MRQSGGMDWLDSICDYRISMEIEISSAGTIFSACRHQRQPPNQAPVLQADVPQALMGGFGRPAARDG